MTLQQSLLLSNTARVIVFGLLAWGFQKWWIVLFAALFLTYQDNPKKEDSHEGQGIEANSPS